ncbi:MAG: shikimate dehydrogenase [Bacillota bacterium]
MGKFAFIVHPYRAADIKRFFALARYIPPRLAEESGRFIPPSVISEIYVRTPHGSATGWVIYLQMTSRLIGKLPEQVLIKRVMQAGRIAEKLGAEVIGLGGLTKLALNAVSGELNIPVIGAGGYAIATALESLEEALFNMGNSISKIHAVVLEAGGAVGSICSLMLSGKVKSMTLVTDHKEKAVNLAGKILFQSGMSARIESDVKNALRSAHLVIAPPNTDIDPFDLHPGSVFYDLTQSHSLGKKIAVLRNDVLVIEGGFVKISGYTGNYSEEGCPPGTFEPCLAETIIHTMEKSYNSSLRHTPDKIGRLAKKHGFKNAGLKGPEGIFLSHHMENVDNKYYK